MGVGGILANSSGNLTNIRFSPFSSVPITNGVVMDINFFSSLFPNSRYENNALKPFPMLSNVYEYESNAVDTILYGSYSRIVTTELVKIDEVSFSDFSSSIVLRTLYEGVSTSTGVLRN